MKISLSSNTVWCRVAGETLVGLKVNLDLLRLAMKSYVVPYHSWQSVYSVGSPDSGTRKTWQLNRVCSGYSIHTTADFTIPDLATAGVNLQPVESEEFGVSVRYFTMDSDALFSAIGFSTTVVFPRQVLENFLLAQSRQPTKVLWFCFASPGHGVPNCVGPSNNYHNAEVGLFSDCLLEINSRTFA